MDRRIERTHSIHKAVSGSCHVQADAVLTDPLTWSRDRGHEQTSHTVLPIFSTGESSQRRAEVGKASSGVSAIHAIRVHYTFLRKESADFAAAEELGATDSVPRCVAWTIITKKEPASATPSFSIARTTPVMLPCLQIPPCGHKTFRWRPASSPVNCRPTSQLLLILPLRITPNACYRCSPTEPLSVQRLYHHVVQVW